MFEEQVMVLDNGSGMTKIGMHTDDDPRYTFPSMVGHPKSTCHLAGLTNSRLFTGSDVQWNRGGLRLKYPIEHGIVTDWNDIETLWNNAFYDCMHRCPDEQPMLLTEAVLNPRINRHMMAEIMFERFRVPHLYVALQPVLPLYASGYWTAVVLDCGDGVTQSVPIVRGYVQPHAIQRINLSGRDLTERLMTLLSSPAHRFVTPAEREIARDIKERLAYVVEDFDSTKKLTVDRLNGEQTYELPDGQLISVGKERFCCMEALFTPSLFGENGNCSVQKMTIATITKCDRRQQEQLLPNIILSGGTTLCSGFVDRLQAELSTLVSGPKHVRVIAPPMRAHSVWIGGSVIASLSNFQEMCVSRKEYNECGFKVIDQKFS